MKENQKVSYKGGVFKNLERKGKVVDQKEVPNNTIPDVVRFMAKSKEATGGKAK